MAVTVDRGELKKYEFTLYHGYQISEVTTLEGKSMPFTQEGDYVTVTNSSDEVIKGIRFYYKGHCKMYYSTEQGVFLPAYLAYYPMPGRKQVYIVQCGYWGNTVDGLGYKVDYDVKVNINNDLYSNLPVTDGNRVIGRSDGLTILCSPFVSEMKMKECRFIYPSLDMEVLRCDWDKENLNKFFAMFENGIDSLAGKTIIIPPYINGDLYYFGGDHFIGSPGALEMEYGRYVQTGELYNYSSEEEVLKELEKLEQAGQE